jgi:cell division protein FtsW (lipid II flippase)
VGLLLLILLLLAAMAGVLGVVLRITLAIVLAVILAMVVLFSLGSWYLRRRVDAFRRDLERRADEDRRRRSAYDVTPDDPPRDALGEGS